MERSEIKVNELQGLDGLAIEKRRYHGVALHGVRMDLNRTQKMRIRGSCFI